MKKETGTSYFILHGPMALLTPIRLPHSLGLFLLPCSTQSSASPKFALVLLDIAGCLGPSSASEIATDPHLLLSCNLIVKY